MKRDFNKMFTSYSEKDGNNWGINWRSSHYKRMKDAIGIMQPALKKQNLKVLEAGCATGDMSRLILKSIKDLEFYDAFDISSEAISICKEKKLDRRCRWFVNDLADLQLNESYDIIICCDVIYYLPAYQQRKCIDIFYEHLEKNGYLFLCVPYDKKEIDWLIKFTRRFLVENKENEYLWLWCKIESMLLKWYGQGKRGRTTKILRALIANHKLMETFVWLNRKIFPGKHSHMYMLLRKE
ncbi:MAG: class I SAM-dependent methyltransferase [Anaeroplasmataceae bacterium]|mgnify:FL=1|nr:class I SAM-dependent methyltransferase [Anaeroplasmataceae bacterium]